MRYKVLVYADAGASNVELLLVLLRQVYAKEGVIVQKTTARDIAAQNALNENVLAFFMPGGSAQAFAEALGSEGKRQICSYVAKGGIYYGICAGAYFACEKIVFEANIPALQIITNNCLGLVSAEAHGTLHSYLNVAPFSHTPASEAVVALTDEASKTPYAAHYHGGPYFVLNKGGRANILARYNLPGFTAPAIVFEQKGQGLVVASGVHFEVDSQALFKIIPYLKGDKMNVYKIAGHLKQKEALRAALVERVIGLSRGV